MWSRVLREYEGFKTQNTNGESEETHCPPSTQSAKFWWQGKWVALLHRLKPSKPAWVLHQCLNTGLPLAARLHPPPIRLQACALLIPASCTDKFTAAKIQRMIEEWEETPFAFDVCDVRPCRCPRDIDISCGAVSCGGEIYAWWHTKAGPLGGTLHRWQ